MYIFNVKVYLSNSFEKYLLNTLITHILLLLVFIIFVKLIYKSFKNIENIYISKHLFYLIPFCILLGIIANITGEYFSTLLTHNFPNIGYNEEMHEVNKGINSNLNFAIFLLIVGVISSTIEELFMRLYAYNVLRRKFNIILAILFNTIIFIILHPIPSILPFVIIGNIVLCLSYEYSKNILIPISIHMTINIYSMI